MSIPRVGRVYYATQSLQQANYLGQSYLKSIEYLSVLAIEYYANKHLAAVRTSLIVAKNNY